mmetsp:Transcript_45694/g.102983  ORF Transcript_45694/g.102983 Transcript_45694/m.102983 type:complete len:216 (-) Transcript_45694:297-944(-)
MSPRSSLHWIIAPSTFSLRAPTRRSSRFSSLISLSTHTGYSSFCGSSPPWASCSLPCMTARIRSACISPPTSEWAGPASFAQPTSTRACRPTRTASGLSSPEDYSTLLVCLSTSATSARWAFPTTPSGTYSSSAAQWHTTIASTSTCYPSRTRASPANAPLAPPQLSPDGCLAAWGGGIRDVGVAVQATANAVYPLCAGVFRFQLKQFILCWMLL